MAQASAVTGAGPANKPKPGGVGSVPDVKRPVAPPAFTITTPTTRPRYIKMLIYGDYGAGKTTLAGSSAAVASMNDVLMIDAEAGELSLQSPDLPPIDAVRVTSYKQAARVLEFLQKHCMLREAGNLEKLAELESTLKGGIEITNPRQYRTAIVDSLWEVEQFCMYQLLGVDDKVQVDTETASAEWAEYKRNYNMVQLFIRRLRDLPMNVIFTCPRQWDKDETNRFNYSPQMTGKLKSAVQGFVDVVGYLIVGNPGEDDVIPRRLYVQPSASATGGKFSAKNRFAAFKGSHFDNPTMLQILEEVGLPTELKSSGE